MSEQEAKNTKPIAETDEIAIATKDIDIFEGWLGRMENPDPTLRNEAKGKGLKLYDEVDADAHAGSVLQTRYLAVTGCEWEIIPADESAKSTEIAKFVGEAIGGFNFRQASQELLQAFLYGYYVAEVMWTVKNGKVVPKKMYAKHPRRFCFSVDRELRLLTKDNMIQGEPLPKHKFIVFSYGSSDNPYGKGLGQKLWWPVWFKKNGIKFWLTFLDRFGQPTPIGKYPSGADSKQKATLLEAIESIRTETGLIVPDSMMVELLESSRSGRVTYETICEYMDKQTSKAVLGQTATTEGTPGKLGNENAQNEVRQDILDADGALYSECLNETLIPWIVDFNYWGVSKYPKLQIRTEPEKELKDLADRDRILVREIGLPVEKEYFYNTYNIPKPEKGELVQPSSDKPAPEFSEKIKKVFTPEQQALENLADTAINQVDLSGNEQKILEAVEKASSYEEAIENILELYPDMDMTSLQETMEQTLLSSEMMGRKVAADGS